MEFSLTDGQEAAVNTILTSNDRVIMLSGAAGTGKSYTLAALLHRLSLDRKTYRVTASTHVAAAVLTNTFNVASELTSTIHSYLGFKLKPDNLGGMVLQGGRVAADEMGEKDPNKKFVCDFLIIDEVSMLPQMLLDYTIKSDLVRNKIVLIGDPIQLTLPGSADLKPIRKIELKQLMRQDESKRDLREYLTNLRLLIEHNSLVDFKLPPTSSNITIYTDRKLFIDTYLESNDLCTFATYTNKSVKKYNSHIRKLRGAKDLYDVGDVISPTSSVVGSRGEIEISNRAICKIVEISDQTYTGLPSGVFGILTDKGAMYVPKSKSEYDNLLRDRKTQAIIDRSLWGDYYSVMNGLTHVHHTFASTVHSLQGRTVDSVFVDNVNIATAIRSPQDLRNYMRLIYVAFSRASQHVHVFIGNNS